MPSFLEKLKKGMGDEISIRKDFDFDKEQLNENPLPEQSPVEEQPLVNEEKPKKRKTKSRKKASIEKIKKEKEPIKKAGLEQEKPIEKKKVALKEKIITEEIMPEKQDIESSKKKWFEQEGELTVDLYQTDQELVIQSAVAGINTEDLDISIENDIITIRGRREKPKDKQRSYFYEECYWGPFSRKIILPVEVDPSRITATMKTGVLTLRIPKIDREKTKKIKIRTE